VAGTALFFELAAKFLGEEMTTSIRALRAFAVIGLIAASVTGIVLFAKQNEEREIYSQLKAYLTPAVDAQYNRLSLFKRLATARHALPAIQKLRDASWNFTATDLIPISSEESASDFVYRLGVGDSELTDCIVPHPFEEPAGYCMSFAHTLPKEIRNGAAVRTQNVPLNLSLGEHPHASSRETARLALGVDSDVQVEGQVMIDRNDVQVTDAVLLVPNPLLSKEKMDRVEMPSFSPRTAFVLQSVARYTYDVTYDMPAALAPFFDNEPKLVVVRANVAVRVDLLRPGFHLEGESVILNQPMGQVTIEYYPGQYASLLARNFSIPAALPSVCFKLTSALLEVDFANKRLRLAGNSEVKTVDSFLCEKGPSAHDMGFLTHIALGFSLDTARSLMNLPETLETSGQLVVDLDSSILCADMAVNGRSLLHAAYLGNAKTFQMWAPKGFTTRDVSGDRFLGSAWDLLSDSWSADWAFPESNSRKCWDGDQGPLTDMRFSLLAESPKPTTVAGSAL
jgi:hypothetical protein